MNHYNLHVKFYWNINIYILYREKTMWKWIVVINNTTKGEMGTRPNNQLSTMVIMR